MTIPIPAKNDALIATLRESLHSPADLQVITPSGMPFVVIYLKTMVDQERVLQNILNPLVKAPDLQEKRIKPAWEPILATLREKEYTEHNTLQTLLSDLTSGKTVVHLQGCQTTYSFPTATRPNFKDFKEPLVERTVRGPRLTFSENLDESVGLIRWGLKNPELGLESLTLGRKTKTGLVVAYLHGLADPELVAEVHRRLQAFEIDGILDSGYLEQLITDNRWSIFPLTQSTERPDKVIAGILEGRVAILVDGSTQAILVPVTLNELYQSPEDYYFGFWFGSFLRFFRILGNNLAVALPGLYVALVGVNFALLPTKFVLTVAGSRIAVATPLIIEVLLMEIIVEIFREASLRLPTTVSQTLGVTAGVVLGIAAIGAGLVSNATLVVVVVTAIASYSGPNFSIGLSWRILKYLLILAAASLGLFGLTIAGLIILAHAAKQRSFGIAYLSPWAPLTGQGLLDTLLRRPLWLPKRLGIYQAEETKRYRKTPRGGRHDR